ncbi:MAG: glycoside hydrolase family 18 [Carboxylicivirga sp.]|jgi:hypothetical protein|nr:glycoside hydrolase family 18 [Carboxylicivirga sp.]
MKSFNYIILAGLMALVISCGDWTEVEPYETVDMLKSNKTEEYYENLRAWKQTDHAKTFGWYGNWTGVGATLQNCMAGLPDSIDFISLWSGSGTNRDDMKFIQEVKGTKVLTCLFPNNLGDGIRLPEDVDKKEYFGWKDDEDGVDNKAAREQAIRKWAKQLCDTIESKGFDGLDIDYEPNYGASGNIVDSHENTAIFCDEVSKRFGPLSGTDYMFVIDGEPQSMPPSTGPMFDYFIVQAYNCRSYSNLDSRLRSTIKNFEGVLKAEDVARRYLVTENFESYAAEGGVGHVTRNGETVMSLEGMAKWNPIIDGKPVRKAGVGSYHMEYEYYIPGYNETYPYLRNAIQIMNPAVK